LCPKRVLFGFGGEQAKRGTRESTHKKGAKGDIQKLAKENNGHLCLTKTGKNTNIVVA
jgi:hypothetical protein